MKFCEATTEFLRCANDDCAQLFGPLWWPEDEPYANDHPEEFPEDCDPSRCTVCGCDECVEVPQP